MKTKLTFTFLLSAGTMLLSHNAMSDPVEVNIGTDANFAILAGSGITVAGAVNTTKIVGDIGTFPTTSITGLQNVVLVGTNHVGDSVTQVAKNDLVTAYNDAAGRPSDVTYAGGFDLVGKTLTSGVYHDASSLFLSGNLTLNGQGDPDSVFIFQTGSTLITASASMITLIGGAQSCNVFWQVGSSATLGTNSDFAGSIIAMESITANTGAKVDGRVLARTGAVTLDVNSISLPICVDTNMHNVPDTGSTLALAVLGLGVAFFLKNKSEFLDL